MSQIRAVIKLRVVRVVARHRFVRIAFARDARRLEADGLAGRFHEAAPA